MSDDQRYCSQWVAHDPVNEQLVRVPAKLERGSPEYDVFRQKCETGEYECAAESCMDRRLEVVTTYKQRGRWTAAHFRHRRAQHGDPGPRASHEESAAHLLAKYHIATTGREYGYTARVESRVSTGDGWRRPDVIWENEQHRHAIEVQFSDLPHWQWKDRNRDLAAAGYNPIWLWGIHSQGGARSLYLPAHHPTALLAYDNLTDIWLIEVDEHGIVADIDTAAVAQAHSEDYRWETLCMRADAAGRRRPPKLHKIVYDLSLVVRFDDRNGFVCDVVDAKLTAIQADVAQSDAARIDEPMPKVTDLFDNRDFSKPKVLALASLPKQPAPKSLWAARLERDRGIREVLKSMPDIEYTCPRCGEAAIGRLYGPCTKCRAELRGG